MKTKQEILNIMREQLPYLKETYGVRTIGLFGSYSRSEQTLRSDVDILVQFEKPIGLFKFNELEELLTDKLGIKVELVAEDALKPLTKPSILRDVVNA